MSCKLTAALTALTPFSAQDDLNDIDVVCVCVWVCSFKEHKQKHTRLESNRKYPFVLYKCCCSVVSESSWKSYHFLGRIYLKGNSHRLTHADMNTPQKSWLIMSQLPLQKHFPRDPHTSALGYTNTCTRKIFTFIKRHLQRHTPKDKHAKTKTNIVE